MSRQFYVRLCQVGIVLVTLSLLWMAGIACFSPSDLPLK